MAYSAIHFPESIFPNLAYYNVPYLIQTTEQVVIETDNCLEQKKYDEEFISKFVENRAKEKITNKPATIKIFQARKYLMEILSLKKQLENDWKTLESDYNIDAFDRKWDEIVCKQNRINDILSIFDHESISALKTSLKKRAMKRTSQKQRKLRQKKAFLERKEKITVKHALIDKLLNERSKEVEAFKKKEALKRQADSVLHEVRKKTYEAKKIMNLLTALLKLRELRSQKEVAQGGYCSQQVTETFESVINHFHDLWKKQTEIYSVEEKGLKLMLEESEHPHVNVPEVKLSKLERNLKQWEEAFFGVPSGSENFTYSMAAKEEINSLIFNRTEWDKYITNVSTVLSSYIPLGWVAPPETQDNEWKLFVQSREQ